MKVKYLYVKDGRKVGITAYPSFHATGSIKGMKKQFYGQQAFLVKCGKYIYNVSSDRNIYYLAH